MNQTKSFNKFNGYIPATLTSPHPGLLEVGMARMCLFDISGGFFTLKESLWNEVGSRASEVLYKAGFQGAKSFLEKMIEGGALSPDEEGLRDALLEYSLAGFGFYTILEIDLMNGYVRISGDNCFEAWAHKEKKIFDEEKVCDYTRGVLSGFISEIVKHINPVLAKDIYCVENKCLIKGHNQCYFMVAPIHILEKLGTKKPKNTQPLKQYLKQKSVSLQKTQKRLKAIENISFICSSLFTSDLFTVSSKVLEPFCELTGANYGALFLVDGADKRIKLNATYGLPDRFLDEYNKLKFTIDSEQVNESWPSAKSILNQQLILINDSTQLKGTFSKFFIESIRPHTIMALASIPLIINGEAIGAITKYYTSPHDFDEEEISFMKTTANIITSTIERNQLLEKSKKSERQLASANDVLKQINQELDSFVYIASHDLREPLRTIESFVGIVQDQLLGKLSNEQDDYFQRIIKATCRMRRLIEDLTNLSRVSRGSKDNKEIDLNTLIMEVQFELTAFIEENKAKISILDTLPVVRGNKEKIVSIFKNLIANGIKFNKSKSKEIEISLEEDLNYDPEKVCICVCDNGIGIEKAYYEKVFGLFQRLHNQDEYEGTGAGLAIVKKILEKYGCEIWIDSEIGVGTRFYFTLPRSIVDEVHDD